MTHRFTIFLIIILSFQQVYAEKNEAAGPIAEGHSKFIGNVYSGSQWNGFTKYWNQITPENAGKWGSVERNRDVMNWSTLDNAYNSAKNHNMPFKLHVLVWGNQQPGWIANLDTAAQLAEIKEWFSELANRYPEMDFVEVVNEPLHDPPDQAASGGGNYINALGGKGETGWDWVINAFKLARVYFPNAGLVINDYNIVNSTTNTNKYIQLIELLQKDSLVDHIGVQAHSFSLKGSASSIKANLDRLANTGLSIYVTELDVDGITDEHQLIMYQKYFPVFWEHPSVKGITLWGYKPGMWRTEQKAYLLNSDNTERPALMWMREYVNGTFVKINSLSVAGENGSSTIDTDDGTLQLSAVFSPENASFQNISWRVADGSLASIDSNGLLTAIRNGTVSIIATSHDGSGEKAYFRVSITNQVVVGIDDVEMNNNFTIFPNPSPEGNFTITGVEKIKNIQITDSRGVTVKELKLNNNHSVSVNLNIPQGVYFVKLYNEKTRYTKKLIIN